MANEVAHRMPWEVAPAADLTTDQKIEALKGDFAFAMHNTAVLVHSNKPTLEMLVNTKRGQIVPAGRCLFKDGTYVEFQDIGMPQPNTPMVSVPDLVARVYSIAKELGLEI